MERIIEEIREDLSRRIAVTADRLADRTLAEDPAYAALLGRAELRERIHHNLRQAVEGLVLGIRGLPVELADARATGTLRAEQGLPLASLLRTYRRGGRLVWQALNEAVAAHDPAALPRLLPAAGVLWDVLDQLTDAVADAYRRTEAARWDRDRERRAALLDALLDGAGPSDGPAVSEAAAQLGLPERGRFAVVVLGAGGSGGSGDPGGPGRPDAEPAASGLRVLWRIRADGETGLVELGHHPLESVRELLGPLRARAGVSPVVETPGDLARARWLAALALRTVPASGGPCTALLDERLPTALVASQAELAGRLRQVVLGPVLALPAEDRRVLLNTLGTWLTCHGSTTYAAQRLYCHRNTVSNRLRRLEQLTGRTLSDPAHVVELALAHAAVLQRAAGEPAAPGAKPAGRAPRRSN
ncbi:MULTISPECIES: PucR family transcriptional regulator [unclassified Streptomyces]|uniref:PucR family transcriptional regulator n=1 Tax=unclassified Streptomyces TaxID=2593676 RepID=UPI00224F8B13|nr:MULTISPECIES: helix-turn-helix domain-containing protein [unclassified Streptomyces]MCX4631549.1 helix-turn-helix domain-containing protein [Streptomyces sp. NBC_01443]WSW47403.1 helix-turn-helix domain-containing protein [Streptomyces sp. NBC_01001]